MLRPSRPNAATIAAVLALSLAWTLGASSQQPRSVHAAEFVLEGEDGHVGMRIAFDGQGRPVLWLYDRDGVERASLGVRPGPDPSGSGQSVGLALNDARGQRTVSLVHTDGQHHGDEQGLTYIKDGKPYMRLATDGAFAGGGAGLAFYGRENDLVVELSAGRFGQEPRLRLCAPAREKGDDRGARQRRTFHVDTYEGTRPPLFFGDEGASLSYDLGGDEGPSSLRLADRRATPLFEKEHP
jgi:hypothetical protein